MVEIPEWTKGRSGLEQRCSVAASAVMGRTSRMMKLPT
jgi:hypothetical protein